MYAKCKHVNLASQVKYLGYIVGSGKLLVD